MSDWQRNMPRWAKLMPLTGAATVALMAAGLSIPALAQDNLAEARIRRMEAEIRALQRQVFPGGDGKFFAPETTPGGAAAPAVGVPASTPVTDLLGRMDTVEANLQRLTAQVEENGNRLRQIEARLGPVPGAVPGAVPGVAPAAAPASVTTPAVAASTPAAVAAAPAATTPATATTAAATPAPKPAAPAATAASSNLAAMTGGASAPKPATPAPAAAPIGPTAQRLAAVQAIAKPQTDDAGDDEYSYGFRLWEARFYPEAQQQLKMMIDRYPRHARLSYARNLLGRAFLDDGKPRDAATWFLLNYNETKKPQPGPTDRASDSLLYLGVAMGRLKDTSRACIALAEFAETYPREAAGRLKSVYDSTRASVKCN